MWQSWSQASDPGKNGDEEFSKQALKAKVRRPGIVIPWAHDKLQWVTARTGSAQTYCRKAVTKESGTLEINPSLSATPFQVHIGFLDGEAAVVPRSVIWCAAVDGPIRPGRLSAGVRLTMRNTQYPLHLQKREG
ncbi:unnamed protein product [Fasciola hepatica]|uniref:Uncharacterized protein n=1 Tax=Fasciola hepatica TaxID=6192 RepID=A0ABC9HJ32_FASHE